MNEVIKFPKKVKPKDFGANEKIEEWSGDDWKRMWENFRDRVAPQMKAEGLTNDDLAWRFLATVVKSYIELERAKNDGQKGTDG